MNFFCITDKDSTLGFRFSGIQTLPASTAQDARQALAYALATPDIGVIIVTDKISDMIGKELDKLTYKRDLPLVLEIPSRGAPGRRKSVGDFLQRSIGMSV
jgi:V/A-type H+-transporting ATPase subunit F